MKKNFSPLYFLASLGAGGIAIMPFAFLQYTLEHGAGLVSIADVKQSGVFLLLEAIMIVFSILHFGLTFLFTKRYLKWRKTENFQEVLNDPLKNPGLMAPFISFVMTMNIFIGPIRFFWPWMAANLQTVMAPAFGVWILIWLALMWSEIKLLTISFTKGFDSEQISFGWLLHPFALGMLTVVGAGVAAMATDINVAKPAAFMSMISGSMGLFLLLVKSVVIFKSHFAAKGLPDKQFIPSFLIVVPNITLYAISAFRLGHFAEKHLAYHLDWYFVLAIVLPFAFEIWYFAFGLSLMKDYFKKHFFNKEYYVTQWGLVCPVVAIGVLGSFAYQVFMPHPVLYWAIVADMILASALFLNLLSRHCKCERGKYEC
jgi:hypothetical protein